MKLPFITISVTSEAKIAVPTLSAYTMPQHEVKCTLSKITALRTITWHIPTSLEDMTIDQGTYAGNAQTSTLTLTPAQLVILKKASNAAHVITCKYTVGSTVITATQSLTLYTPG